VARMLAKKPKLRPQTMADVLRAFEIVARTTPSTIGPGASMPMPGGPIRAPGPMPFGTPQHRDGSQPNLVPPMPGAGPTSHTRLIVGLSIAGVVVVGGIIAAAV